MKILQQVYHVLDNENFVKLCEDPKTENLQR